MSRCSHPGEFTSRSHGRDGRRPAADQARGRWGWRRAEPVTVWSGAPARCRSAAPPSPWAARGFPSSSCTVGGSATAPTSTPCASSSPRLPRLRARPPRLRWHPRSAQPAAHGRRLRGVGRRLHRDDRHRPARPRGRPLLRRRRGHPPGPRLPGSCAPPRADQLGRPSRRLDRTGARRPAHRTAAVGVRPALRQGAVLRARAGTAPSGR